MKQKNSFKNPFGNIRETIETNKKLVYILMIAFMVLGIIKIYYEKSLNTKVKTENLEETSFLEEKMPIKNPVNNIGIIEAVSLYNEVKEIAPDDTLKIREVNKKLNKILSNED